MPAKPAPVVLFVYNRPDHLQRTLRALQANAPARHSQLVVYSDGPAPGSTADADQVRQVRAILDNLRGFRDVRVISRPTRRGLARSVITGLDEVAREHDRFIVMEDDIVTAPHFLDFLNEALDAFGGARDVHSVSTYVPLQLSRRIARHCGSRQVFLSSRPMSWGWGTWSSRWQAARWDRNYGDLLRDPAFTRRLALGGRDLPLMLKKQVAGTIDSWAVRWVVEHALADSYALSPVFSLIENIGLDRSGTHGAPDERLRSSIGHAARSALNVPVRAEPRLLRDVQDYFRGSWTRELAFRVRAWRRSRQTKKQADIT